MKILIVGSNPAQKSNTLAAFDESTASGRTLRKWLVGVEGEFEFINVVSRRTASNRRLSEMEVNKAIPALQSKIEAINPDRILTFGSTARDAIHKLGLEHHAMPHPSGLNRQLNDPQFVQAKIKGMLEFLQSIPQPNS